MVGWLAGVLDSFANTLLDLGLPKIKEWLKNRLGPNADVGSIKSEGKKVILEKVTIPIGPRGLLELSQATCTLAAGGKGGLPGARLSAFTGVLTFGNAGEATFTANVVFEETKNDESAWVHGKLGIAGASWSLDGVVREGHVPMDGEARLVVTMAGWEMADGILRTGSAEVKFAGAGKLEGDGDLGRASLNAKQARTRHFIDGVTALAGAALPIAIPPELGDPILDGDVTFDGTTGKAKAKLLSDAFDLEIEATVGLPKEGEPTIDAKVTGKVFPGILLAAVGAPEHVRPESDGEAMLDLIVTGSPKKPLVNGSMQAAALPCRFGRPRFLPPLVVEKTVVKIVKSDAEHVELEGSLVLGDAPVAIAANVPFAPAAEKSFIVRATNIDAGTIASFTGMIGIGLEGEGATFSVPTYTRARCEVNVKIEPSDVRAHGMMVAETPRSRMRLALQYGKGVTDGSKLTAELAFADAIAMGLFPFEVRPRDAGFMAGTLDLRGPFDDLVLEGGITSNALEIVLDSRPEVPPFVFTDLTGHFAFGRRELTYRDVTGTGYGGTLRAKGRVVYRAEQTDDRMVLDVDGADEGILDALARLATGGIAVRRECRGARRPKDELWIPAGTVVSGQVRLDPKLKTIANFAIEHAPDTALLAELVLTQDLMLDGSTIKGKLSIADALTAGAFDTTLAPLPEGFATVDATLKGRIDDAALSGVATADTLRVAMRESPNVPPYTITNLKTMFRIDRQKIVWHKLSAEAYGGTLRSSGMIRYAENAHGIKSTVDWSEVDVAELPIAGGDRLGKFVRGALSGKMDFERHGPEGRPIMGRGSAAISSPEYPALHLSGAMLARYGLPPPTERGAGDLTAKIDLVETGWHIRDVGASVDSCLVTGGIGISFDSRIDGRFTANVGERYLRKSTLLTIPAVFAGTIDLPVYISGSLTQPHVRTDVGASLENLLVQNRVTGFIDEAVDDVSAMLGFKRKPVAPLGNLQPDEDHASKPPPPLQDEDAIVKEMIAKGADWDEIEWRLDEIRRQRARFRAP